MPTKHAVTGRWHDPKYSLRRQAELVKLAREHGVEELLPFTIQGHRDPRLTQEGRVRSARQGYRCWPEGQGS